VLTRARFPFEGIFREGSSAIHGAQTSTEGGVLLLRQAITDRVAERWRLFHRCHATHSGSLGFPRCWRSGIYGLPLGYEI